MGILTTTVDRLVSDTLNEGGPPPEDTSVLDSLVRAPTAGTPPPEAAPAPAPEATAAAAPYYLAAPGAPFDENTAPPSPQQQIAAEPDISAMQRLAYEQPPAPTPEEQAQALASDAGQQALRGAIGEGIGVAQRGLATHLQQAAAEGLPSNAPTNEELAQRSRATEGDYGNAQPGTTAQTLAVPFQIASAALNAGVTKITDPTVSNIPGVGGGIERGIDTLTGIAPYSIPGTQALVLAQMGGHTADDVQAWKDGRIGNAQFAKSLGIDIATLALTFGGPKFLNIARAKLTSVQLLDELQAFNATEATAAAGPGGPSTTAARLDRVIASADRLAPDSGLSAAERETTANLMQRQIALVNHDPEFVQKLGGRVVLKDGELYVFKSGLLSPIQDTVAKFRANLDRAGGLQSEAGGGRPFEPGGEPVQPGEQPVQSGFDAKGAPIEAPVMPGDKGVQGDLLGSPASTGEGLSLESAGPMFAAPTTNAAPLGRSVPMPAPTEANIAPKATPEAPVFAGESADAGTSRLAQIDAEQQALYAQGNYGEKPMPEASAARWQELQQERRTIETAQAQAAIAPRAAESAKLLEGIKARIARGETVVNTTQTKATKFGPNVSWRVMPDGELAYQSGNSWLRLGTDAARRLAGAERDTAPAPQPKASKGPSVAPERFAETSALDPTYSPENAQQMGISPTSTGTKPISGDHLYHFTDPELLAGISRTGLTPKLGEDRPSEYFDAQGNRHPRPNAIYAADNAAVLSAVDRDTGGHDWTLLRLKAGGENWQRDPETSAAYQGAWITKGTVPPANIEYWGSDKAWHPISQPKATPEQAPAAPTPAAEATPAATAAGETVTVKGQQLPATSDSPYFFENQPPSAHAVTATPLEAMQARVDELRGNLAANPMAEHTGMVRTVSQPRPVGGKNGGKTTMRHVTQILVDAKTLARLKAAAEAKGRKFFAVKVTGKKADPQHPAWWTDYEDELHGFDGRTETPETTNSVEQLQQAVKQRAEITDLEQKLTNPDAHMDASDAALTLRDILHYAWHAATELEGATAEEAATNLADTATAYDELMANIKAGDMSIPPLTRLVLGLPPSGTMAVNGPAISRPQRTTDAGAASRGRARPSVAAEVDRSGSEAGAQASEVAPHTTEATAIGKPPEPVPPPPVPSLSAGGGAPPRQPLTLSGQEPPQEPPAVPPTRTEPMDLNAQPPPRPLNALEKVRRFAQRMPGLGEATPKWLVSDYLASERLRTAGVERAPILGRRAAAIQKKALENGPPKPSAKADAATRETAAAHGAVEGRILRDADLHPGQYDLTPAQRAFLDAHQRIIDEASAIASRAKLEVPQQKEDIKYIPRVLLDSNGQPVADGGVGGFMKGRTTGTYRQFLAAGHNEINDMALAAQYHYEQVVHRSAPADFLRRLIARGDPDGKGPAVINAKPGSAEARTYQPIPELTGSPPGVKQWLARPDIVHEFIKNVTSPGLGSVAGPVTKALGIAREVEFALGGFHILYENVALGLRSPGALPKALGTEIAQVFGGEKWQQYLDDNEPGFDLWRRAGAQGLNVSGSARGQARDIVRQARGNPEQESLISKIPYVGGAASSVSNLTFKRVVPIVIKAGNDAKLAKWVRQHPKDVPSDFDELMRTPVGRETLANDRGAISGAIRAIAARGNKTAGFTENTLGSTEKQISGLLANTPTITRAMIANLGDAFRPWSDMQGDEARRFWVNALIAGTVLAVGGTMLAQRGKSRYTDPTDPKFVMNPAAGKFFLAIVHKDGTTTSIVPSPIRSALVLAFNGPANAANAALNGSTPQHIFMEGVGGGIEGAKNFISGRVSRPLAAVNVGSQAGGSIERRVKAGAAEFFGSNEPIVSQQLVEHPPHTLGDLADTARGIGYASIGAHETPATPYETADRVLREHGVPNGMLATPAEIAAARKASPEVAAALDAHDKAQIASGTAAGQLKAARQKLEAGFTQDHAGDSAKAWLDAYHQMRSNLEAVNADIIKRTGVGERSTGNAVLDGFYKIYRDPALVNLDTGQPHDSAKLFQALDEYTAAHPEVEGMLGTSSSADPRIQRYQQGVQSLQQGGYFGVKDQAVQTLDKARGWHYQTYNEFLAAMQQKAQAEGKRVADLPEYKAVTSLTTKQSTVFRANNPQMDALTVELYGTKPRTKAAADIVFRDTGQRVPIAAH